MLYCIICFRPADDPHHIRYRSRGGGDGAENRAPLCRYHHTGKESIHSGHIKLIPVDGGLQVWVKNKIGTLCLSKTIALGGK